MALVLDPGLSSHKLVSLLCLSVLRHKAALKLQIPLQGCL